MVTLIVLSVLSGSFGVICFALASFSKGQRKKHPIFRMAYEKRVHLFFAGCILVILGAGAGISQAILSEEPSPVVTLVLRGDLVQKATQTGFEEELEEASVELASEARDYFNAAEHDFEARRYEEAAINYQRSVGAIPTMSAYLNLGVSLVRVARYGEAEGAFNSGLQMAQEKSNSKGFEGAFASATGVIHVYQGRLEEATKAFQRALDIAKRTDNPLGQADALMNTGIVYRHEEESEDALKSFHTALEAFRQASYPLGQALVFGNIGNTYLSQGKLDEAAESYQKALDIWNEIGSPWARANTLMNLGIVYTEQGKPEEALELERESLEVFDEIDYRLGQAQVFGSIGNIHADVENLDEALQSYQKALGIFKEIGYPLDQANASVSIGSVYAEQGKLEDALIFYLEALSIFNEIGNTLGQADVLGAIDTIHAMQGRK